MRVFYIAFIWVLTSLNFSYFILSMTLLPVGSNVQKVISFALISHHHDFLLAILFSNGACTSLASGPSQIYIAFLFKSYHLFVYFCLSQIFFAVHVLSLVAASQFLIVVAFLVAEHRLQACRLQQLQWMSLVALQHAGSSQNRAQNHVPCIHRQILKHCTTRDVPFILLQLIDSHVFNNRSFITFFFNFFPSTVFLGTSRISLFVHTHTRVPMWTNTLSFLKAVLPNPRLLFLSTTTVFPALFLTAAPGPFCWQMLLL